jgi:hypothetical protein
VNLPISETVIERLQSMDLAAPIVVAGEDALTVEDALGLIALAQRPGPDLHPSQLVNAGLNGFAVEMLVESVRQFRDFEKFGPFRFSMRGVSITVSYDPASDDAHKARRAAHHLPEQDPHWKDRPHGDLADVAKGTTQ